MRGTDFGIQYEETADGVTATSAVSSCDRDVDSEGPLSAECATEDEAEEAAIRGDEQNRGRPA